MYMFLWNCHWRMSYWFHATIVRGQQFVFACFYIQKILNERCNTQPFSYYPYMQLMFRAVGRKSISEVVLARDEAVAQQLLIAPPMWVTWWHKYLFFFYVCFSLNVLKGLSFIFLFRFFLFTFYFMSEVLFTTFIWKSY